MCCLIDGYLSSVCFSCEIIIILPCCRPYCKHDSVMLKKKVHVILIIECVNGTKISLQIYKIQSAECACVCVYHMYHTVQQTSTHRGLLLYNSIWFKTFHKQRMLRIFISLYIIVDTNWYIYIYRYRYIWTNYTQTPQFIWTYQGTCWYRCRTRCNTGGMSKVITIIPWLEQ